MEGKHWFHSDIWKNLELEFGSKMVVPGTYVYMSVWNEKEVKYFWHKYKNYLHYLGYMADIFHELYECFYST